MMRIRVGDRVRTAFGDVGTVDSKGRRYVAGHPMLGRGSTKTLYRVARDDLGGMLFEYEADDLTVIGHDRYYEA